LLVVEHRQQKMSVLVNQLDIKKEASQYYLSKSVNDSLFNRLKRILSSVI